MKLVKRTKCNGFIRYHFDNGMYCKMWEGDQVSWWDKDCNRHCDFGPAIINRIAGFSNHYYLHGAYYTFKSWKRAIRENADL